MAAVGTMPHMAYMAPAAPPIPVMAQGHPDVMFFSAMSSDRRGSPPRRNVRGQRIPRPSGGGNGTGPGGARRRNNSQGKAAKPNAREEAPAVTPLYKTRLCNFHSMGACKNGSTCSFAHGSGDLRPSPDFERTSVCPVMLNNGVCDRPSCRYAHNVEELRTAPGLLKTKMCSFFLNGLCVVGEACRFAHSVEELREAVLVQNSTTTAPAPPSKKSNTTLWELRRNTFREPPAPVPPQQNHEAAFDSRPEREDRSPSPVWVSRRVPPPPAPYQAQNVHTPEPPPEVVSAPRTSETTPASGPAQVVNKKVVVNINDDDEDFLPVIRVNEVIPKPQDDISTGKREKDMDRKDKDYEAPPFASASASIPSTSSEETRPGRANRLQNLALGARKKVVIDIEDFVPADMQQEEQGRGGSSSPSRPPEPHTVERRRWTKNDDGWSRPQDSYDDSGCGLHKARSKGCALVGQFAECAMCPRGRGSVMSAPSGGECPKEEGHRCAACNCGLKVVARNTFLTICDPNKKDEDQVGSRKRCKSS